MNSQAPDASSPAIPAAAPAPETEVVHSHRISCDGGEGALGHPRVWLSIPEAGWIDCPYCDKRFVLAADAGHGHH